MTRRYVSVRLGESGLAYVDLVAERDKTSRSAALRHLLRLGQAEDKRCNTPCPPVGEPHQPCNTVTDLTQTETAP